MTNAAFRSGMLAGLVLGVAVGAGAIALLRRAPPPVPLPAPRPAVAPEVAALREENDRLKKRVAELEKVPAPAVTADPAPKDPVAPDPAPEAPDFKALFAKFAEGGFAAFYDAEKTKQLVDALKKAGKSGIDFLAEILRNSKSATERIIAAGLLEGLKDPAALPALLESLKLDKDPLVRRMAAHGAAMLQTPGAEDALRAAMNGDSDWGVRANAAYGVAKLGKEDGLRLLQDAYESTTTPAEYRLPILMGLADVAAASTAPLFRKILGDSKDEGYLLIAIGALEKIKDVEAIPSLQRVAAADHPDTIRQAAEKAIEGLRK